MHPQQAAAQPAVQSLNQSAEFFLSNYRLGKTLGIGSFGKVSNCGAADLCKGMYRKRGQNIATATAAAGEQQLGDKM
jgi:hypothetical protein